MSSSAPGADGPRWTPRAYLFLAFGGVLVALALVFRSPVPIFVGLPLLVVPFAAGWTAPRPLGPVELAWEAGGAGRDVQLSGTLAGPLGDGAQDLELRFRRPAGAVEVSRPEYDRDGPGFGFRTRWRLEGPTIVTVPPPEVVWRDPGGLVERTLGGGRPTVSLQRYPAGLRGLGLLRLDRTISLPGESRSRRVGPTGEFFGLREAQPLDPIRRINWVASARAGRLLVNDYQLDRTGDLVILLDLRPTPLGRRSDERLLNLARAAAHGMTEELLRGKIRLGFATFGEFVQALPLSTGRVHRLRILHAILLSRLSDVHGPSPRCAVGMGRYFRPGTTTLVVSSCAGDPGTDLVPHLRRRGFPTITLSPSPLALRRGQAELDPDDELLASRIETLQRRLRLSPLWRYGPVVDWNDYWSLTGLTRYLRQPNWGRRS